MLHQTTAISVFSLFIAATALSEAGVRDVPVEEFQALVSRNDGIILDVRTPEEVAQGHLPGASILNIYDDDFLRKLNLMQKDKPIYVYCRSGGRSSRAAQIMSENGFDTVYNLEGGIGAWNRANLPTEKPDRAAGPPKAAAVSLEAFQRQIASAEVALVDFHTEWCAPCKQMAPVVDALEDEFRGAARVLRIDVDASPELAKTYAIEGVPVFILFENGRETWRHSGVIAKADLRAKLSAKTKR